MRVAIFIGLLTVAGGSFGLLASERLGENLPHNADEAYGRVMAVVSSPFGGTGAQAGHGSVPAQPAALGAFSCDMNFTPPPQNSADASVKVNCQNAKPAPRGVPGASASR